MKTLKLLSRLEVARIFSQFRAGKQKVFGIFIYLLSLWGIFALGGLLPLFASGGILDTLPEGGKNLGVSELVQTQGMIATVDITIAILFFAVLIISFFQFQNTFFHHFDQSTLWSQPIDIKFIIISKFVGSWVLGIPMVLAFSAGSLVICYLATHSILKTFLLMALFFAVEITAECFGYFLRTLTSRTSRNLRLPKIVKSLLSVLIFASFMILYYYEISREFKDLAKFVLFYQSLPAAFRFISFTVTQHTLLGMLVIALAAVVFFAFVRYLSRYFFDIAENANYGATSRKLMDKDLKPKSLKFAILKKELLLYWSNSAVAMNTFFGAIMPFILAMLLLVPTIYDGFVAFLNMQAFVPPEAAIFLILLGLAGFMNIAGYSFSLEGKSAYVTYTLPLSGRQIFLGKLLSPMVMLLPLYFVAFLVVMVKLKPQAAYIPFYLIGPIAYILFINGISLLFDLRFANYKWTTPQEFAKNSKQAFFSSFGSIIVSLIMIFVGITIMTAYPLLYAALLTILLVVGDMIIFLLTKNLTIYHQ